MCFIICSINSVYAIKKYNDKHPEEEINQSTTIEIQDFDENYIRMEGI